MLDNNQLDQIKRILSYNRLPIRPDDFSSKEKVRKAVLAEELEQELDFLRQLIESGHDFESSFRNRLQIRNTDQQNYIGFFEDSDTLTNRLYWDIASIIEKSKNPQEMLAILHPDLNSVFSIEIDETHVPLNAKDRQAFAENPPLAIHQKSLNTLNTFLLTHGDLAHYIVIDDMLVDVRQILSYSLKMQWKLYNELKGNYPKVFQALYKHNSSFVLLQDHFLHPGSHFKTPRDAIIYLEEELRLSGGNQYATNRAHVALANFSSFLDDITLQQRDRLLSETNLLRILESLKEGNCVEINAARLRDLLAIASNKPLLDSQTASTEKERLLQKHIEDGLMNSKKDSSTFLPTRLVKKIIPNMVFQSFENLLDVLIFSIPTEAYHDFFTYINIVRIPQSIWGIQYQAHFLSHIILQKIKTSIFSAEQKQALSCAMIHNHARLGGIKEIEQLINANNYAVFIASLKNYSTDQEKQKAIHIVFSHREQELFNILGNIKHLECTLAIFSNEKTQLDFLIDMSQIDMIQSHFFGYRRTIDSNLFYYLATNPDAQIESLQLVLNRLSKHPQLTTWSLLNPSSFYGETILLNASSDRVKVILDSLASEEERFKLLKKQTVRGDSLLSDLLFGHGLQRQPEQRRQNTQQILSACTEEHQLQLISNAFKSFFSINYHEAINYLIDVVMPLFHSDEAKLKILQIKTNSLNNLPILFLAIQNPILENNNTPNMHVPIQKILDCFSTDMKECLIAINTLYQYVPRNQHSIFKVKDPSIEKIEQLLKQLQSTKTIHDIRLLLLSYLNDQNETHSPCKEKILNALSISTRSLHSQSYHDQLIELSARWGIHVHVKQVENLDSFSMDFNHFY